MKRKEKEGVQVRGLQSGAQKEEKITEIENQRKRSPTERREWGAILNQNFNIWNWLTKEVVSTGHMLLQEQAGPGPQQLNAPWLS